MHTQFWKECLKGRDHLDDLGTDRRMNLKETGSEGMDWTHLVSNRNKWQILVNMLMTFQVPLKENVDIN
jgi:hypothetical protein